MIKRTWDLKNVWLNTFDKELRQEMRRCEHAKKVQELILKLLEKVYPKAQKGMRKVGWWAKELGELRKIIKD